MPKLPKSVFAFSGGQDPPNYGKAGRIHQKIYSHHSSAATKKAVEQELQQELDSSLHIADSFDDVIQNDLLENALFLRTLTQLLHARGMEVDAPTLFTLVSKHPLNYEIFSGSQTHLIERDLSASLRVNEDPHREKTSTHYGLIYRTIDHSVNETKVDQSNEKKVDQPVNKKEVRQPVLELDSRVWKTLASYGIGDDLKQTYNHHLLRIANLAQHDYIHQYIYCLHHYADCAFPHPTFNPDDKAPFSVQAIEKNALGLHAQILAHLFREEKIITDADGATRTIPVGARRKQYVLEWAAEAAHHLATIQDTALQQANAPSDRAAIKEAVTYLTEAYMNRFFRTISPNDPDLYKEVALRGTTQKTTVAAEFDAIALRTPGHLLRSNYTPGPAKGLRKLRQTWDDWYTARRERATPNAGRGEGFSRLKLHAQRQFGHIYEEIHNSQIPEKLYELNMPRNKFLSTFDDWPSFKGLPTVTVDHAQAFGRIAISGIAAADDQYQQKKSSTEEIVR